MMRTIHKLTLTGLATLATIALVTTPATAHLVRLRSFAFTPVGTRSETGIGIDQETGDLYVGSSGTGSVAKYSASGVPESFTSPFFGEPQGVAVDNSNGPSKHDVYVTEAGHHGVVKLDSTGSMVADFTPIEASSISTGDVGAEKFNPFGVTVDPENGDVVVGDVENGEVDIFSENGAFISQFTGGFGFGVAVGAGHHIFTGGETVQEWSPNDGYKTPTAVGANFALAVAFDLSTGRVFGDETGQVAESDLSANPLAQFGVGDFSSSFGVAVYEKTNTIYVTQGIGGTAPAPVNVYEPPVVVADAVTGTPASTVTSTTASVNGTVNPAETTVAGCRFEYGLSTSYGATGFCSQAPPLSGGAPIPEVANFAGLQPNAIYHYRLVAVNANAPSYGEDQTFTTSPAPPSLDDQSVSGVSQTSAILDASVNPNNQETTYHFEFGPSTDYGTVLPAPDGPVGSGYGDVSLGQQLSGLSPGTTYHYRVVASNATSPADGTVGPDRTFTTLPPTPPLVGTGGTGGVSSSAATISGSVNPQGVLTTYEFDLGVDTGYGTRIFGIAGSGSEAQTFSASLSELTPNTTYHYRLIATNVSGTSYGPDRTFATPAVPGALLTAPSAAILTPAPPFPSEAKTKGTTVKKPVKKKAKARKKSRAKTKKKGRGKK